MLWTIDGVFDLNLMFNGRQFALISHLIKLCEQELSRGALRTLHVSYLATFLF